MSTITGKIATGSPATGGIRNPEAIRGRSAYEIAVAKGFDGTVDEWLASINGKDGKSAYEYARDGGFTGTEADFIKKLNQSCGTGARIGEVTLTAIGWNGSGNLFSQVVSIDGVTANSQVDLTPSVEQLAIFHEKDLAFVTENEDGVVTVYAIGQKPENDYTIQVTITEVAI